MEEVPTIDDINNVVMTTRNNITLSTLQALTGSHEIPILSLKLVSSSSNSKLDTGVGTSNLQCQKQADLISVVLHFHILALENFVTSNH